ncbi:hypothetical protein RJ639_011679 [Escallonia herrerae]|uniref:Uncharacterized protein n=1 Tax=Escallonia herrerae TaxID=1293975 RepID=A0AA89ATR1_9ASTE|nr:hypothetical protein RJ639_011679 [Escallonia herrerae]
MRWMIREVETPLQTVNSKKEDATNSAAACLIPFWVPTTSAESPNFNVVAGGSKKSFSIESAERPQHLALNHELDQTIFLIPFQIEVLERMELLSEESPRKKGSYMVEIVDVKCGNPDRAWASPIANRLKKLGFSKLSESIV